MYLSVSGNILNGISVPAYSAKSMPDVKTGSTGSDEPVNGVSNQQNNPLPVLSSEDTIYVLIDTDNNYLTGYSSIGMDIGAEKMVEIKGHYGIMTLRVIKEWTGTNQNDWEWTNGELIDAAASGSELELEVIEGNYWIHIVGWNGDDDSSRSFTITNDGGRYSGRAAFNAFYYRFNGDLTDSGGDGRTLSTSGSPTTSATGKMGNGLTLDGSSYVFNSDETDMLDGTTHMRERDWSFETWVKPSDSIATQPIFFVGDGDGDEGDDEFQIGIRNLNIELCFNDCSGASDEKAYYSGNTLSEDTWTHIAVVWDQSEVGHEVYIDGFRITGQDDTSLIWNSHSSFPTAGNTEYYLGKGDLAGSSNGVEGFVGMLDDARFSEYARGAFAGGLMFSEVIPAR